MGITVDMPPAMVQEAREYASMRGMTLEQMVFGLVSDQIERYRRADEMLSKIDNLVDASHGRLSGKPYKFNRADAYEPEVAYV